MPQLNFNIDRERINKVWQRYKIHFILGGILLVVLGAALFILSVIRSPAGTGEGNDLLNVNALPDSSSNKGFFLPQSTRTTDDLSEMRDPFTFMTLKGTITGSSGQNMAIIEAGNNVYVAEAGSKVAGTWEVIEINSSGVLLRSEEQEMRLEFNGRVKTSDIQKPREKTGDESEAPADESR